MTFSVNKLKLLGVGLAAVSILTGCACCTRDGKAFSTEKDSDPVSGVYAGDDHVFFNCNDDYYDDCAGCCT